MRTVPLVASSEPSIRTQTVTDVAVSGGPAAAIAPATLLARIAIPPMNAATSAARFLITRAHLQPQPRKNRRVVLHEEPAEKPASKRFDSGPHHCRSQRQHTPYGIRNRSNIPRTGESWPKR